MKIIIIEQALDELRAAVGYYEDQQSGLGLKLTEEIDQHVKWISQNADIPRLRPGGYRRVNLKIFPFYIAYIIKKNVVWIAAIAHGCRKPGYWVQRKI